MHGADRAAVQHDRSHAGARAEAILAVRPGGSRPPVDSQEPARISSSPATALGPRCSPSSATPSATATTGFTYVITVARPGPTSPISAKNNRKASALHATPSTSTERIVWPDGVEAGAEISANGASTSAEMPIEPVTGPSAYMSRKRSLMIIGPAA